MKKLITPLLFTVIIAATFMIGEAYAQHHMDVKTLWSADSASSKPKTDVVTAKNDTIEVRVGNVESYSYGGYIVRLEPKYEMTDKYLPVVIGQCEASSIQSHQNGTVSARPMTYDMFLNMLTTAQLKIQKVVVVKLENGTYYASIALNDNGKISWIDSRPSDAINLAIRANATVYVMRKVLEDAGELR